MIGAEVGTEDCVMSDAIPFDSLAVETEAGTGTEAGAGAERPTPRAPPIQIPIPIAP